DCRRGHSASQGAGNRRPSRENMTSAPGASTCSISARNASSIARLGGRPGSCTSSVQDLPVARYGTSRAPRAPRRSGCGARNPVATSRRTWCRVDAGLRSSRSAISLLVCASSRHTRRIRSRTAEASARASASVAGRRSASGGAGSGAVTVSRANGLTTLNQSGHAGPVPGSLLRHRDFRLLWAGDTISQLGTQVTALALPLLAITTLYATPFQVGLLTTFEYLSFLLVGLPAGAWVDRVRRRSVLIAGDVGRALLLGSLPVAAWLGMLGMPQLYLAALGAGLLTVFFDVASQSSLPHLVGREHLVEGNAKLQASQSVAVVAGPTVGGLLVQALTAPYAVLVDAASFLWS